MPSPETATIEGVQMIPGAVTDALERFEQVWQMYRKRGRGRDLSEGPAEILRRLSFARVGLGAVIDTTRSEHEWRPILDKLAGMGISFGSEVEALKLSDLGIFEQRGLMNRSYYLSKETLNSTPAVVEAVRSRWG